MQRAPDAVEDRAKQPGPELRSQRASRTAHRLLQRETAGFLEDLDRGNIVLQANHLAKKPSFADFHELVKRCISERPSLGDCASNPNDARFRHCSLTR